LQSQNKCEANEGLTSGASKLRGTQKIQNMHHLLYHVQNKGTVNIIIIIYVFTPLSNNCESGEGEKVFILVGGVKLTSYGCGLNSRCT
jgi:hypothetical protein